MVEIPFRTLAGDKNAASYGRTLEALSSFLLVKYFVTAVLRRRNANKHGTLTSPLCRPLFINNSVPARPTPLSKRLSPHKQTDLSRDQTLALMPHLLRGFKVITTDAQSVPIKSHIAAPNTSTAGEEDVLRGPNTA